MTYMNKGYRRCNEHFPDLSLDYPEFLHFTRNIAKVWDKCRRKLSNVILLIKAQASRAIGQLKYSCFWLAVIPAILLVARGCYVIHDIITTVTEKGRGLGQNTWRSLVQIDGLFI